MAYEFRLAVVDDVSKQMKTMQKSMDGVLDVVKNLQNKMDQIPGSVKNIGDETEKTGKKAKGLLKEITTINRTLRRTTTLFGAAFGIGQISQFTNEVIGTEQNIANLFGVTGQELKGLTSEATKLATVFGVDVNESVEAANTLTQKFGISASDSFGLIEQALSKGVSKEFLSNIEELSPAFKQAGLGAENMIALLAQGQRAGVGDELAKGYAEAIDRLSSLSGEGTIDALGLIGLSPDKIKKAMESGEVEVAGVVRSVIERIQELGPESVAARQALEGIFGGSADALQGNLALLNQVPMSLSAIEDRTTDATRAQQYLFGAWADFKIFIAENVVPVLADVVSWVKENQESLLYWGSLALKVASAFTGIWLAAKSIMMIKGMVMTITTAFSSFSTVLKIAQGATLLFNAALWANPITWVVGSIVGLGAAVYGLITYWDEVKNWLYETAVFLWEMNPLSWMINFMEYIFPGFKDALKGVYDAIVGWFGKAFGWINDYFVKPVKNAIGGILRWLGLASDKADETKSKVQEAKNATGESEGSTGPGLFGDLAATIKGAVSEAEKMNIKTESKSGFNFSGKTTQPKGLGKNLGVSAGIAGVQSEGPKAQNLTINITKLIESLNINTTNLKDSTSKIKEEVTKALLASVNDVNASIG